MFARKLGAALAIAAAATGLSSSAFAIEGQDDFMLFKMKSIDKNNDGMVSKKEFMAMMDKAYDTKAKAMGATGGMLTERQMLEFLRSLYYVGGN